MQWKSKLRNTEQSRCHHWSSCCRFFCSSKAIRVNCKSCSSSDHATECTAPFLILYGHSSRENHAHPKSHWLNELSSHDRDSLDNASLAKFPKYWDYRCESLYQLLSLLHSFLKYFCLCVFVCAWLSACALDRTGHWLYTNKRKKVHVSWYNMKKHLFKEWNKLPINK